MIEQLICWIGQMSDDEVEVVHAQAAQMMGEGRKEYGELNLDTDKRTILNLIQEAIQEHDDHAFYARCAMTKFERLVKELFGAEA